MMNQSQPTPTTHLNQQQQASSYATVSQPQGQAQSTPFNFTGHPPVNAQGPLQNNQSLQQPRPPAQPFVQQQTPSYASVIQPSRQAQSAPFNFTGRQAASHSSNSGTGQPNPGVLTNQFKVAFGNPLSAPTSRPTAPGY